MDKETRTALVASICHWVDNYQKWREPEEISIAADDCALCELFYPHCFGCPVRAFTRISHCRGTPYAAVWDAKMVAKDAPTEENLERLRDAIHAELMFLHGLLKATQEKAMSHTLTHLHTSDDLTWIPQNIQDILAKHQEQDPLAVVAGGVLRDLFLGRAWKDVDIFTAEMPDDASRIHVGEHETASGTMAVGEVEVDGILIDYIQRAPARLTMDVLLPSFDFGACQIGFDGQRVYTTSAFLWDVKHEVFTLRRVLGYPASIVRYARWRDRYNWPIVIPEL